MKLDELIGLIEPSKKSNISNLKLVGKRPPLSNKPKEVVIEYPSPIRTQRLEDSPKDGHTSRLVDPEISEVTIENDKQNKKIVIHSSFIP